MIRISHTKQSLKIFLLATICLFTSGKFLFAQADTTANDVATPQEISTAPVVAPPLLSEVTSVVSADADNPNEAGLGDEIMVNISNVKDFVQQARNQEAKIVLYINDTPVKDVVSEISTDGIRFFFENKGDVTDLWDHLLSARSKGEFFEKKVSVTVGIEGSNPIPTKVNGKKNHFQLILVRKKWLIACVILILVIFAAFIYFAKRSDMLRDTGIAPAKGRKPYSLARVQMGIWFLAIVASWLFLYVCLHRYNLLTDSVLILLGITSMTGVGGVAMDANKTESIPSPSEGILKDIVTDKNGVSLLRFQNMVWTVVLALVFLRSVFCDLKIPEFDSTLLTLMGISSGTYIAGKVTEKKGAEIPVPETPGTDQQPG